VNYLTSLLKSRRLWGLSGTAVVLYFLVVVAFGKVDVSWFMPDTNEIARTIISIWPRMPFFTAQKQPADDGKGQEVYYTVPTRQLSPQELTRMGVVTNATVHPAAPK
jgi:hypothetical protein